MSLPAESINEVLPEPTVEVGGPAPGASRVAEMFREHAARVTRYLGFRLHDAEAARDATQDVFLRLWRQEREGRLRPDAMNYMYAASQSAIVDVVRRRSRDAAEHMLDADSGEIASEDSSVEDSLHWRNAASHFVNSVMTLPDDIKTVLLLHLVEGLEYVEVARRAGISKRTVERNVAKGLRMLRRRMRDYL